MFCAGRKFENVLTGQDRALRCRQKIRCPLEKYLESPRLRLCDAGVARSRLRARCGRAFSQGISFAEPRGGINADSGGRNADEHARSNSHTEREDAATITTYFFHSARTRRAECDRAAAALDGAEVQFFGRPQSSSERVDSGAGACS